MRRIIFAIVMATLCAGFARSADEIPFPAALDGAAVVESRLADINREALVLGNGDLIGLLWQRGGALCLRVAKNDIWDARIDTSGDSPLMKVDVANTTWSGGAYPPSWKKAYPQPRCAAMVRIGEGGETGSWQCIRALGKTNEWLRRDGVGIMAISGAAGKSAGYRRVIDPEQGKTISALKLRLAGTPGAQFYVNIFGSGDEHLFASGWKDSPATEQEFVFPVKPGTPVSAIELFVMTRDGSRVENRVSRIAFEGGQEPVVIEPGMEDENVKAARLDLRRAMATVENLPPREGITTVRALADRNVFLIETDREVSLEEIRNRDLPAADTGETEGVKWLATKLPGDSDYPGMEYALAVAAQGPRKAVSCVTSWDTKGNVRDAAVRLARETAQSETAALAAAHEREWSHYWSASGVELEDPEFQPWWYRMAYYLRCFTKPGVAPVGLFAGLANDSPPWHGDYHHNYNVWQPYWAPLVLNHPELTDPWARYMKEMLPRLRWIAKTTYDCEGACIGISSFAFEPDPAVCKSVNRRQIMIPPYGYTLGMAGMSAQDLWLTHLYRPDRKYLEEMIYPVLRDVALFYGSFAEKCPRDSQGKAIFGPSYSPEHGKFGVANVPFDLAYARLTMQAAIDAAGELGRDGELAERLRRAVGLLPAYPVAPDEAGKPVVVDWTGCGFGEIKVHNITVPAVPVFPAGEVTRFSPTPNQDLFRNTVRQTVHRGCNSTVMLSVAKARFSMLEALEDARGYYKPEVQPNGMFHWPMHGYYLSESVGIAAMISEFLLQSADNIIVVFPCWPKEKDGAFADLRAQGGFLVSAKQAGGKVTSLKITSTAGGKLRLLCPWPRITVNGRECKPDRRGIAQLNTDPGENLYFREAE